MKINQDLYQLKVKNNKKCRPFSIRDMVIKRVALLIRSRLGCIKRRSSIQSQMEETVYSRLPIRQVHEIHKLSYLVIKIKNNKQANWSNH